MSNLAEDNVNIMEILTQFHFLRPVWLLALIPALILFALLLGTKFGRSQWQTVIDPQLQPYMLDYSPGPKDKQSLWWLLLAWLLTTIALAGPTWQQLPQPVSKNQQALIIMLDLSYSMASEDIKPSRYKQATQKITDILRARQDGLTGMVVYSGAAHTVTPLTDDADTITNLLPSLSPYSMPKAGSRPEKAIELAQQLVINSGITKAKLLLITDGIQTKDINRIEQVINPDFDLSILAVGTNHGSPIPLPQGGFLKDSTGTIVIPQLDTGPIQQLTQTLDAHWHPMKLTDDDWQSLLDFNSVMDVNGRFNNSERTEPDNQQKFDVWLDQGYWLLVLIVPVVLLSFRRGVLFSVTAPALLLTIMMMNPGTAYAFEWRDLWQTPDQQGAELLERDPSSAAEHFENPNWKGTAAYRAGDFQQAIDAFQQDQSATGHYNLGNALAQSGQLQAAIEAYDKALALEPELKDAAINRQRVQQALQQQSQQPSQDSDSDKKGNDSKQSDSNAQQQNDENRSEQGQNSEQQNGQGQNNQRSNQADQPQQGDNQKQNGQSNDQDKMSSDNSQAKDASALENNSDDPNTQNQQNGDLDVSEHEADQTNNQSDDQKNGWQQDSLPQGELQETDQKLTAEQQTRLKQWLNRVPDQPGKLLERKFLYQYQQQYRQSESDDSEEVQW